MAWLHFTYGLLLIVAMGITLPMGLYAWRRRETPGATPLAFMALTVAWWTIGAAGYLLLGSGRWAGYWVAMEFLSLSLLPPAWLVFSLEFTARRWKFGRIWRAIALGIGLTMSVLVATNGHHFWVWHKVVREGQVVSQPSTVYWIFAGYGYLVTVGAIVLLLGRMMSCSTSFRWQYGIMALAGLAPLATNLLLQLGGLPRLLVDPTLLGIILSLVLIWWGLFRLGILDLVPVAHSLLLENMSDGMLVIDRQERILEINRAACALLTKGPGKIIGQPASQTLMKWESLRDVCRMENGPLKELTMELDDHPTWLEIRSTPLQNRAGQALGYLLILRDITERKKSQEERQHLLSQLFQSQKMEAVGTLAGGIAHDFNNILGTMLGYAELILASEHPLNQEDRDSLIQVLKAGRRAKDLVRQILTFSRHHQPKQEAVNLDLLVKESMKLMRASLPSTIEIQYEIEDPNLVVIGDLTQLHQVVMNLCTNAGYAMKEKGGRLHLSLARTTVDEIQARALNHEISPGIYARLIVSDSGPGIPRKIQERIFEPFFTTKPQGEGTGLGLSVVLGIVKNHGGAIQVLSPPGWGATFTVWLPLMPGVEKKEPDSNPVQLPLGQGERVLLVDDEGELVQVHQKILKQLGYQVVPFRTSTAAWEAFASEPHAFDLVLTDQTMPGMTGLELAGMILQIRPEMKIILCTGYSDPVTDAEARKRGILDTLRKPLSLSDVAYSLENALRVG